MHVECDCFAVPVDSGSPDRLLRCLARLLVAVLMCGAWMQATSTATAAEKTDRPNLVVIMADDMGFSDIGCYGSEIQTPNLDRLAGQGVRFTQFYNTARCCPTRASLLTGLYPHQAGVGHMMEDRGLDGYRGNLNRHCRTFGEVLRPAGYSTYMSGKWHVTRHVAAEGPKFNWPLQRGFDRFFGTIHGAGSFFDPNSLTDGNTQIPPGDDFYYTDAIVDHAITFVDDHHAATPQKPFFLYVAFTCPHWPMHARPHDIAKYKGRYDGGWDLLREERQARMVQQGLIDKNWQLTPRDRSAPAWDEAPLQEWHARRMEVYAAMIDCMDQNIGRLLAALEKNGQSENTVIFFLADNGGCAEEFGSNGAIKPDPSKPVELIPMQAGQLQTQMVPSRTRDGRPLRTGRGVMPGPADTFVAYGLPWANASNTPFRRYKHWVHEGGISSPLIIHWPAGIRPAQHGQLHHQPSHLIDIMATCVDLAGAEYPTKIDDQPITPLQGVSLKPALAGQTWERAAPLFWEHEGNRAIRQGDWKLVAQGASGPWELYNIASDRTELNNLAAENPTRVEEMAQQWEDWATAAQVKPWPYNQRRK
ncbi:arylsulfatase [Lignipirellula cremea]|uniref:Arylsulfatase n=1 Tax=Lignipirellula cremea TaxID=2528010 RepID=A0A518DQ08_9BACT|nr:arylsulfatase [Lignipirellula cremea]QDU93920.1 Arylsulfatase [Lignipirellula cremea]